MHEDRDRADPQLQAALAHFKAERWSEAIEAFSRIAKADPFHFTAAAYLGASYYQVQDFEAAARAFETAAEIKSDSANVHYNLGLCYRALQETGKARRSFENALKLQSEYPQAQQALASLDGPVEGAGEARCENHTHVVAQGACVSCGKPFCSKCLELAPPERRPLGADASQDYYICAECLTAPKGPSDQLRKAQTQKVPQEKVDGRGKYYGVITSAAIEGSTTEIYEPRPIAAAPPIPIWRRIAVFLAAVIIVGGVLSAIYLFWYSKLPAGEPLTYTDPGGAFTITAPAGWKVTKDKRAQIPGKSSAAFAPKAGVIAYESAVLMVDYDVADSLAMSIGFGTPNMDRIRKGAIEMGTMPAAVGLDLGTMLKSEQMATIAGVEALLLEFEGSTLGEVVVEKQAWLIVPGGKVCVLTFRADKRAYDRHSDAVEESMMTFLPKGSG